jgi:hypothetical protein
MNKYILKLLLGVFVSIFCMAGLSSCSHTVYVRQQGQTYHDYEANKHDKVVNATKRPKMKKRKSKLRN